MEDEMKKKKKKANVRRSRQAEREERVEFPSFWRSCSENNKLELGGIMRRKKEQRGKQKISREERPTRVQPARKWNGAREK